MTSESGLRAENQALRRQLENLLHEARQNEEKMRRFDRLERQLIAAGSLQELVRVLLDEYRLAFALDCVSLVLLDRDGEVASLLERVAASASGLAGLTLLPTAAPLEALYGDACQTYLGAFAVHHQPYFDAPIDGIASVALLPLKRQGELIGSLHFGSADPERYAPGCATDLLERLAAVIAICLQSALTQERLKLAGLTDALTGAHNRRYFEHRCQVEISQARRHHYPLCCMFIDVDHFKRINDRYGHPTGDDVLCQVAQAVQAQLRAGDTIARYGGEEFVILLPQSGERHALQIAERIRHCIEALPLLARSGEAIGVTISLGLSALSENEAARANQPHQQLAERLIAAADQALYRAKKAGRNRVECAASLTPAPDGADLHTADGKASAWRTLPRRWSLLAKKR